MPRRKKEPQHKPWTLEERAEVKRLWQDGLSGGEIAKIYGVSRSAICGMAWRGGYSKGAKVIDMTKRLEKVVKPKRPAKEVSEKKPVVRQMMPKPVKVYAPIEPSVLAAYRGLSVDYMSLGSKQCKFVVEGTGETALFCGEPVKEKSSYCDHCHRVVYRPSDPRLERGMRKMVMFMASR